MTNRFDFLTNPDKEFYPELVQNALQKGLTRIFEGIGIKKRNIILSEFIKTARGDICFYMKDISLLQEQAQEESPSLHTLLSDALSRKINVRLIVPTNEARQNPLVASLANLGATVRTGDLRTDIDSFILVDNRRYCFEQPNNRGEPHIIWCPQELVYQVAKQNHQQAHTLLNNIWERSHE